MMPAYFVLSSRFIINAGRPRPRCIPIQIESGPRASWVGRRRVASGVTGAASSMNEVTRILSAIEQGDPQAAEQLLPLVYDELRKLAAQRLAQEKPGQTLQATALVHEAYLRLVGLRRCAALGRPRPFLRRGGRGHAPHPRREGAAQAGDQARRAPRSAGPGSRPDRVAGTCEWMSWSWTRPSIGWRRATRRRRSW